MATSRSAALLAMRSKFGTQTRGHASERALEGHGFALNCIVMHGDKLISSSDGRAIKYQRPAEVKTWEPKRH
jgi:hypothetical protein